MACVRQAARRTSRSTALWFAHTKSRPPPDAPGSHRNPRRQGQMVCGRERSRVFDIAIECAAAHGADPSTLVRAARDFCGKEPKFAARVALLALSSFLAGGGYNPSVSEVDDAVKHLLTARAKLVGRLGVGRTRQAGKTAMRGRPGSISACRQGRPVALASWRAQPLDFSLTDLCPVARD